MNRRERRIAAKKGEAPNGPTAGVPMAPVIEDTGKPGIALRIMSRFLLSNFVLKRVSHPQVLSLLAELARQSRRMDVIVQIQAKLAAPHGS